MAQPESPRLIDLLGNAPAETLRGSDGSLLVAMRDLGPNPPSGRLLRGLTPWLDSQGVESVFLFSDRKWREPWSDSKSVQPYQEIVHWRRDPQGGAYRGAAWRGEPLKLEELGQAFQRDPSSVVDYAARRTESAVISNRQPLRLGVTYIPKPWGREGWFTGIERRGLSRVVSSTGQTDLPYALGMFPWPLMRTMERQAPILLKTLEPHPDEGIGDLYLEVHQEKWETYIVLAVDKQPWPSAVGAMIAGLDADLVETYQAEHQESWRGAAAQELQRRIAAYEQIRRSIDAIADERLRERGLDPTVAVPLEVQRDVAARVPAPLRAQERRAREDVEAMLGRVPMRVGDVAALPPGVLHSLRHGVKVVEFQTPTYERTIAMSTQKVLTQAHWDTARAMERMVMAPFEPPPLAVVAEEPGLRVESVVSYPEFAVERARLEGGHRRAMSTGDRYRLIFVVEGQGKIRFTGDELALAPEDALLLPATLGEFEVSCVHGAPLVYLDALPNSTQDAQ